MFGRYPFGGATFGKAPASSATVVLFGHVCATALVSLDALQRVTNLNGARAMTMTSPLRGFLNRNAERGLGSLALRHRLHCED